MAIVWGVPNFRIFTVVHVNLFNTFNILSAKKWKYSQFSSNSTWISILDLPKIKQVLYQQSYITVGSAFLHSQEFFIYLPHILIFSNKYFIMSKVYTDEAGIKKKLYHGLSTCKGDNPC